MKGYIYDETREVIAMIIGDYNSIVAKYNDCFDNEEYMLTFSPAFGASDGLIIDRDFEVIDVRGNKRVDL